MELENNEEGKGKGNKKRIAIIAVVVAALIAAGILYQGRCHHNAGTAR